MRNLGALLVAGSLCCLVVIAACEPEDTDTETSVVACSDAAAVEASTMDKEDASVTDATTEPDASDSANTDDTEVKTMLGADGGTLTADDGRASVEIPAGTLAGDTTISIALVSEKVQSAFGSRTYDFGPNGTEFNGEAEICLEIEAGKNTDTACLGYLDEKELAWKCQDSCLRTIKSPKLNMLCGKTNHFTDFAILLTGGGGGGKDKSCGGSYILGTGGKVSSPDNLAVVSIPDGALDKATRVSIAQLSIAPKEIISTAYALWPNGTFKKPVELCLTPNPKAETTTSCLGYFDEKKGEWTCQDTCLEQKGGQLCGTTDHFTNFALLLQGGSGTSCK